MDALETMLIERANNTTSNAFRMGVRGSLSDYLMTRGHDRMTADRRAARAIPLVREQRTRNR